MQPDTSAPTDYAVRFGFDRRTTTVLIACAAFVALLIWMPAAGVGAWVVKVVGLALFGLGGLMFAVMSARGGVALSVDAHGITLGTLMPHVPDDVLLRSRPVNGWRLDERRLCEAVAAYAPAVPVVRLDEAGEPHPVMGE